MKRYMYLMMMLLTLGASSVQAANEPYENGLVGNFRLYPVNPSIRVLIARDVDCVQLTAKGQYRVYDPLERRMFASTLSGKSYPVKPTGEGIRWGEEFPDVYQITVVPSNPKSSLWVNGVCYPGSITIYQVGHKLTIVNEVQIEDYVKLTLPDQIKGQVLCDEVVAALAVIARTDATYSVLKQPCAYWHVRACDVGYFGLAGAHNPDVVATTNATRYLVLQRDTFDKNDKLRGLFMATWTEHCAGQTVAPQVIYRRDTGWATETVSPKAALQTKEQTAWTFSIDKSNLSQLVGVSRIDSINPFRDPASGKVYALRFQNSDTSKDIDVLSLQKSVGADRLQSTEFTVQIQGDVVVFSGYGKGDGCGLCLFSAQDMACHGKDAMEILRYFFPGTHPVMFPRIGN